MPSPIETVALAFARLYVRRNDGHTHTCVVCGAVIDGVFRTEHYYWHLRHNDVAADGSRKPWPT